MTKIENRNFLNGPIFNITVLAETEATDDVMSNWRDNSFAMASSFQMIVCVATLELRAQLLEQVSEQT